VTISEPLPPASRGLVPVDGGAIDYAVYGSGPPVVFAHGIGGNRHSWFQQVSGLSGSHTCITFSHRGFAASHDDTGMPRPQRYGADLVALLDHLAIQRTAIVAQSMGGWTALEFALLAPERLAGLVIAGSTGSLRLHGVASLADSAADPEVIRCRADGISPAAGRRMATEQPELHELYVEIDSLSGDWDRAPVRTALDGMRVREPAGFSFACPALALVGAEDIVCPPRNVQAMAAAVPQIEMVVIPETGHSAYFERPGVFNQLVSDYFNRIEALQ